MSSRGSLGRWGDARGWVGGRCPELAPERARVAVIAASMFCVGGDTAFPRCGGKPLLVSPKPEDDESELPLEEDEFDDEFVEEEEVLPLNNEDDITLCAARIRSPPLCEDSWTSNVADDDDDDVADDPVVTTRTPCGGADPKSV